MVETAFSKPTVRVASLVSGLVVCALCGPAEAGRPTLTDSASSNAVKSVQLETWVQADRSAVNHYTAVGYTPFAGLDLSAGFVHGFALGRPSPDYGLRGPMMSIKYTFLEPTSRGRPGASLAAIAESPTGMGELSMEGWTLEGSAAITIPIIGVDRLALSGNIGWFTGNMGKDSAYGSPTWGAALRSRFVDPVEAFFEVHSGDNSTPMNDALIQGGLSFAPAENLFIDLTAGKGLEPESTVPLFGTVGFRFVML